MARSRKPLDHPTPERPHRIYVALTNYCNRACPWCSVCSSPAGTTFLPLERFHELLPTEGTFQLQLEGGEPTLHPDFWEMVRIARESPRLDRLIVSTNGVVLPRDTSRLRAWLSRLGKPLTLKLSFNHHLWERDPRQLEMCVAVRDELDALGGDRLLVLNVRLRRGYANDDRVIRKAVESAGLLPNANVFFLQSYGFASGEQGWDPPHLVSQAFTLIGPDGRAYGTNLIARAEAMRRLP